MEIVVVSLEVRKRVLIHMPKIYKCTHQRSYKVTEKQPTHRSTHVVGTRMGRPREVLVLVERNNVEAEVDVLVHAGVMIRKLEADVSMQLITTEGGI